MPVCERCGTENPDGFRFCGACAAPLPEPAAPRQTRKVVTTLFCDVTGSTALGEELDPEVLRGVMNRYFAEIRATIERHGGIVEEFIGDAVMAVFGIPRVHEDDALRAVRAAADIRERLPAIATEVGVALRFRTGINTGPVLIGEGENLAIGDAVNVAARHEQAAEPGGDRARCRHAGAGARRGGSGGARATLAEGQVRAGPSVPALAGGSSGARGSATPGGPTRGPRARARAAPPSLAARGRRIALSPIHAAGRRRGRQVATGS